MSDVDELSAYLASTTRLEPAEARRVVRELLEFLAEETAEAFAIRRHRELKAEGTVKNDAIYRLIAAEMAQRPFAAPRLTQRQIRRLIYG